jgi:exopolyphosphatase/guanosine-5'-triphosphate,3'-diphosphate pyrophosphatase
VVLQKSFNVGTVRILTNKDKNEAWEELKYTLKELAKEFNNLIGIGSGGNINKLFSISGTKNGKPLLTSTIKEIYIEMEGMNVEERMHHYNIRQDRAEVLVPALSIYTNVLKWANIEEIYVPKIGLADGLIHHLYDQVLN